MKNKSKLIFIIITFLLLYNATAGYCYWIWTPQTKKWVNPKYAPKDTPKEQLLYSMDFFYAEEYKKSLKEFNKIIKFYKRSEAASEAQYFIGRCYEELNNSQQAYESYQKVIDDYPFTQRTDEIIKRQFDIAGRLYEGENTKFVGISFKAVPEQIIEIYKKVVSNAPYSEYAPISQYRIGELYKKIAFYQDARDAFQKILDDYPDSDMATDAKFQVAMCASIASGGSDYDQSLAEQAMDEFEEFAKQNPDSELVKKAREERKEIIEKRADYYLKTARFYERIGKYKAASIYYNKILDEFPSSSAVEAATKRLEAVNKRIRPRSKTVALAE